jgi:hypothetical protein
MNRHLSSEQLSAHLDGEVAFPESREIAAHLASCEGCRDRFEALQRTVGGVWRLERAAPPMGLATRVRAEVAVAASRPQAPVRSFVTYVFGLSSRPVLRTAAAMGLALALSLVVVIGGERSSVFDLPAPPANDAGVGVVTVLVEPPLILPQTTSKVAGREFVWTELSNGDVWVQRGLEGEVPEARLSAQSPKGRELLAKYSELGLLLADGSRVVLRYRLETVELSKGV